MAIIDGANLRNWGCKRENFFNIRKLCELIALIKIGARFFGNKGSKLFRFEDMETHVYLESYIVTRKSKPKYTNKA